MSIDLRPGSGSGSFAREKGNIIKVAKATLRMFSVSKGFMGYDFWGSIFRRIRVPFRQCLLLCYVALGVYHRACIIYRLVVYLCQWFLFD